MTDKLVPVSEVLGRILLALIFIMSGISKIGGYEGTQGYMEAMGVPGALLPLVIVFEIVAGLMVVVGFQTRLAALGLIGFCIISGFLFHYQPQDQIQMILFMKNIAMAGGFFILFAHGAGQWSVDAVLQNRKAVTA